MIFACLPHSLYSLKSALLFSSLTVSLHLSTTRCIPYLHSPSSSRPLSQPLASFPPSDPQPSQSPRALVNSPFVARAPRHSGFSRPSSLHSDVASIDACTSLTWASLSSSTTRRLSLSALPMPAWSSPPRSFPTYACLFHPGVTGTDTSVVSPRRPSAPLPSPRFPVPFLAPISHSAPRSSPPSTVASQLHCSPSPTAA